MATYYIDTKFRLGDIVRSKLTQERMIINQVTAFFAHDYSKVYKYTCRNEQGKIGDFTEIELEEVNNEAEVDNFEPPTVNNEVV